MHVNYKEKPAESVLLLHVFH